MPVGGELADEEGRFVIEGLERGSYTVSVGFVGYTAAEAPLLIGERNDHYDLGDLPLERAADVADEVIVTAQRQILDASLDRRVFDLGEDIARTTGSVLDAMRGLPGVTVSQEGQIQLRGSDRVAILVDGKQSGLTGIGNQAGLDSIPAGSIESIEVINNPSAAFDAAGMAGVINIVYRQDQAEGLTLDAGVSLGVGQISKAQARLADRARQLLRPTRRSIRASISSTTAIAAAISSRPTCCTRTICRTTSSRRATTTTAA